FFRHEPGRSFIPHEANANLLMVAANPDDARADTHWLRADFDAHLVGRARQAGVAYLDHVEFASLNHEGNCWHLQASRPDGAIEVRAAFAVDATGDGQWLAQALGLESITPEAYRTRSRALYSHFTGVARWADVLHEAHGSAATAEHPF